MGKQRKKYSVKFAAAAAFFAIAALIYLFTARKDELDSARFGNLISEKSEADAHEETNTSEKYLSEKTTEVVSATEDVKSVILVYVCGKVVKPGVYELSDGDRVFDAINKACGVLPDGNPEALNLAKPVKDGEKIYVPGFEEIIEADINSEEDNQLVNINTADLSVLMTLPGIGSQRAQAIIDYRSSNGLFENIEDIMNVSGIKQAAYDKIKDLICIR